MDAARLQRDRIVQISEVTGREHSDIEDLFEVDEYLSPFNKSFGTSISAAQFGQGDRILKRLTDVHGAYDHYKPAHVMLRHPEVPDNLSDATLDRFERLFERINGTDA